MLFTLAFAFVIQSTLATYCNGTDNDLKDKVVIVTGAANGIGRAIAENIIIKEGVKHLIILDIDVINGARVANTLNSMYGPCRAVFIRCDITTDLDRVSNMILKKYGYVHLLVNNAGVFDESKPRRMITTNTVALAEWSIKFWEAMRKDKRGCGGTIINIGSVSGYMIDPLMPIYKSSKFGVIQFSKSLGHTYNYKKTGVRVICVNPGMTDTSLIGEKKDADDQSKVFTKLKIFMPAQKPDSVAKAVVQVYKNAKSGTAWDAIGGKPPSESPDIYTMPEDQLDVVFRT